jgi:hypothetical protein
MQAMRQIGSFTWLTNDLEGSALVSMTNVNATTSAGPDRAVIGKGLGWEIAWSAYRQVEYPQLPCPYRHRPLTPSEKTRQERLEANALKRRGSQLELFT